MFTSQAPWPAQHQNVHAWYAQGKETTDNPCTNCNNGCTCGDVSASFDPYSERDIADAAICALPAEMHLHGDSPCTDMHCDVVMHTTTSSSSLQHPMACRNADAGRTAPAQYAAASRAG